MASLTDEQIEEAVAAFVRSGSKRAAATELGIERSTLRNRLKAGAERGLLVGSKPAMPGFRVSRVSEGPQGRTVEQKPERGGQFEMPAGHVLKGVSTLVDEDGRTIIEWRKTRQGELDPLQVAEWLKAAFADVEPCEPVRPPPTVSEELLTLVPLADWHLGMFAWGKEVGENWDLKIAEQTIGASMDDLIARSPASGSAVVLGGGDLIHSDTNENKTARSGNALQVDGRYQKVVAAACRLTVRTVDSALLRHAHVTVRIIPGNHDEHACVAVAYYLSAFYRNEPRVTVDVDPSLFWWHRFGRVLLGATHGHTVKVSQMPMLMAHRRAEDWGATRYRYVHGFHLHHTAKTMTEGEGVVTEIHQAPVPQDAWHFGAGYLSGRSLQAITYHRDFGEIGRVRTAIMDAA